MEICCDLIRVDINGQHSFWVNKELLLQFSSKLANLFEKNRKNFGKNLRVIIFQDFPGGPTGFELITRFMYNNGFINITHSNVLFLNHVAQYMELNKSVFGRPNLIDQTKKFLERIVLWSWSELLLALTHFQCFLVNINQVPSLQRLIDEVVERLKSRYITTPSSLSSLSSSFRSSCDSKNTTTLSSTTQKSGYFRLFWWFEDLSSLSIDLIDMLVRKMVLAKFDNIALSKFLFYYHRVGVLGTSNKFVRVKIIEMIINLLSLLDKKSISIKGLFEILRVASKLKLRKTYMRQLEILIGLELDQASLDDLLLPSKKKSKKSSVYNVNLVLRFLKNFLHESNINYKLCSFRLKKVARLMDLYANEIAPDSRLKHSKFVAIVMAIPNSARDSCDKIYQAIEIYLEVHPRLSEEQKANICAILNYSKLSSRLLNRLSRNIKFPLLAIVEALIHQNPTLKSCVKDPYHLKVLGSFGCRGREVKDCISRDEVLVNKLAKNDKFKVHMQEMGWTGLELENMLYKLQTNYVASVIMTPKVCCTHNIKHLPRLCS